LGILDVFKKKKEEDESPFGQSAYPASPQGQNDFQYQQDQGFNSNPDLHFGQQPQGFSQGGFGQEPGVPAQQPQYSSPEQMGFERVKERDTFSPRGSQSVSDINLGKDMELINAKLDAIKSELDSINQRIKRMERMSETGTAPRKDQWY
jgi:hypothetical protein